MSASDVDGFFQEYVFGFIFSDIRRELDLARSGTQGGNFLAALGLLCYTEVLGGVKRGTLARGQGKANFDAFFSALGQKYRNLVADGLDAYSALRCGMAHEYLIKGRATVTMLKGVEPSGVAVAQDGHLFFCVERYFDDFAAATRTLHAKLVADPRAALPLELGGPP